MAILCPECDRRFYAVCDFCKYYDFNPDEEGRYDGRGWCNKHKLQKDPEEGCEDFHCFNVKNGLEQ